jgi:hypothetical protein
LHLAHYHNDHKLNNKLRHALSLLEEDDLREECPSSPLSMSPFSLILVNILARFGPPLATRPCVVFLDYSLP